MRGGSDKQDLGKGGRFFEKFEEGVLSNGSEFLSKEKNCCFGVGLGGFGGKEMVKLSDVVDAQACFGVDEEVDIGGGTMKVGWGIGLSQIEPRRSIREGSGDNQ